MEKKQKLALWACFGYFVFVFLRVLGRAMWGILRIPSEYRDETIPRQTFLNILSMFAQEYWVHARLIGIGVFIFGVILIYVSLVKNKNKK